MLNTKTICILGAGNAGMFAAHLIKHRTPGINVYVVGSQEIGIVGVGESSTEHIAMITKALDLTPEDVIRETGSTYKYGVWFDWHDEEFIHALFSGSGVSTEPHKFNDHDIYEQFATGCNPKDTVPINLIEGTVHPKQIPNQFHFDTYGINKYLIKKAKERVIPVYDDKIVAYNFADDGSLKSIESETNIFEADIFIDASGFNRLLANQVEEFKWVSQQHNMFVDSAFAFPTEHKEGDNYLPFTMAKKMKSGWMWQIPVWKRRGNGYCYNSEFTTYEEAVKEVEEYLGHSITPVKKFKFEAGHYQKTWHKNMVLCGLSSHFFEPLEATAMGIGIQQANLLCKYLAADEYDELLTDAYNEQIQNLFTQMWTFIRLHYHNVPVTSPFWQHVKDAPLPKEIKKILDISSKRMLSSEDIEVHLDWYIFHELNFNQVLYGIGALSPEVAEKHVMIKNIIPRKKEANSSIPGDIVHELVRHRDYVEGLVDENSVNN